MQRIPGKPSTGFNPLPARCWSNLVKFKPVLMRCFNPLPSRCWNNMLSEQAAPLAYVSILSRARCWEQRNSCRPHTVLHRFNPLPARCGTTISFEFYKYEFQSSPSLGAGSNAERKDDEQAVQMFQSSPSLGAGSNFRIRDHKREAKKFQSSPSLGAGSNILGAVVVPSPVGFQSSPSLGAGSNPSHRASRR